MNRFLKYLFLLCFSLKSFSQDNGKSCVRENYKDFDDLVATAKSTGRSEYVRLINKRLENNEEPFIYGICELIKEDSLTECIPNLKKFITNCKRGTHTEYTIYRLAQLGSENDREFVVNDFQVHLNQKLNSLGWLKNYIVSLEKMNIPNAHNLLDQAFFDWCGINMDFTEFPKLFEIKKELEDQFSSSFSKDFINEGCKLNHVIAFIDNSAEVRNGGKPKPRYIVEIDLPYESSYFKSNNYEEAFLKKIEEVTKLPKENINLRYKNGMYYRMEEERFDNSSLTVQYIDYLSKYPNDNCLNFIRKLHDRNYFDEYDKYYAGKYLNQQK